MGEEDELDIVGVLDIFVRYRATILKMIVSCALLAMAFAYLYPPRYQADISVQLEDSAGAAAAQSLLGGVSSIFDINSPASAEQQIMASRLVVASVVDELRMDIEVHPERFPIVGNLISRMNDEPVRPGVFGIGGWAWGSERAEVNRFDVPKSLEGDSFTLTMLPDGKYRLSGWDLDAAVIGRVGQVQSISTGYGPIEIFVKGFNALPGTSFKLVRNSRLNAITDLQSALKIEEQIKSSGVLVATLKGADPLAVRDRLMAVGHYYIKQNVDRKASEAAQSLAFLETQVPVLRQRLEDANRRYTQLREKQGSIDLSEEAKIALQQSADATTRMLELKQKRDQLVSRLTSEHPDVVALDAQIRTLSGQQRAFDQQIKRMPVSEQDAARLMLEVKIDTELYTTLLSNIQQLELIKAGKTGTVRVVDVPVVPEVVVFPNRPVTIAIGAMLGLLIGIGYAFAHSYLFAGISSAEEIESHTGFSVYATIPKSDSQPQYTVEGTSKDEKLPLLAQAHPDEPAMESLRSLRTALQFVLFNSANNIVLLTGPAPGIGKSFISSNFSALLARSGKRVLLIDGDLRRGYLRKYFGVESARGFSDAIAGIAPWSELVKRSVMPNLDFLSAGSATPDPSELLAQEQVQKLLKECSSIYDVVIIDSAPVLTVTDAVILARHCANVMLVARAGLTRVAELSECGRRLEHGGSRVTGVLFNGVDARSARLSYGNKYGTYRYVRYDYTNAKSSARKSIFARLTNGLRWRG
ncbi:polysaccharide biosynthesis tyrosine autokinase [Paraburkholderia sp. Ac-20340]|uniref:polysaccharide biosynthesis tyrosine autokinase n=1 Tax=Paraburkholderia sp. Ac-20340 TaxID=2703888 RepID=UPI0019815E4D|nr:polysaccharide biosynthesis tyrosine autokinase [Paraburkholderia sp. Ac-20340]MBN3854639.1 polysaccharide biosynthesis tyrosine autokinase [Paraburkholderia sp. Ac-20340]